MTPVSSSVLRWRTTGVLLATVLMLGIGAHAAQTTSYLRWVKQWGNTKRDAGQAACALPDGSFLVLGWFEDSFLPPGQWEGNPRTYGLRDIYVAKFDAAGEMAWVKSAGTGHCDVGGDIDALPDGTFAITAAYGYGGATATFGGGEANQTRLYPYNRYDIATAKFNADGTLQWARRAGSYSWDSGIDVALAPDGSCYVVGAFDTSFIIGDDDGVDSNEVSFDPANGSQFLAKYDTNGILQWAKQDGYSGVTALSDSTCVAWVDGVLVRYAADGSELWRDDTLGGSYATEACGLPSNLEMLATVEGSPEDALRKYRFDAKSATVVWETPVGANGLSGPRVAPCADGGCFVFNTYSSHLMRFAAGGELVLDDTIAVPVDDICATQTDDTCLLVGTLYSEATYGLGQDTEAILETMGSGDIVMAKYLPTVECLVLVDSEGCGGVALDPPGGVYPPGTEVTLTAMPTFAVHDVFDHWEGDVAGAPGPVVTVTAGMDDIMAYAVFVELPGAPPMPAATGTGLLLLAAALAAVARWRRPAP